MKLNVELNSVEVKRVLKGFKDGSINKSDSIRGLFKCGMEVKEISKELGIIYNMVYNIVNKMIIREDLESSIVIEKKKNFLDELESFMNSEEGKSMKKNEIVRKYIKEGRGEGYIYSSMKKLSEGGRI